MTTSATPPTSGLRRTEGRHVEELHVERSGWVTFACSMLVVLGVLNVIYGLAALNANELLEESYLFSNFDFWGWTMIVGGAIQFIAGVGSFSLRPGALMTGMIVAGIGLCLWFLVLFSAPFSAIIGMVVCGLILHGLSRGLELVESR